jgi:hypothetical protein
MSDVFITVVSGVPTAVNLAVPGVQGPMGLSTLPSGGTVGQIVVKQSAANFDAVWTSAASGLTLQGATRFALGSSGLPSIAFSGDTNTGIYSPSADTLAFVEGGAEAMRIDSSARLLLGTTANITGHKIQSIGSNPFDGLRYEAIVNGPIIRASKSRSTTPGTFASVLANDTLGNYEFAGDDGTAFAVGARITAQVDGTPGTGSIPGRLLFQTTSSGSSAPVSRLVIANDGRHTINSNGHQGTALTTTAPAKLFLGNGAYTDASTAASGTVAHGTIFAIENPAIAATSSGVTYTNASTVYIHGGPTASTNVTIDNPFALFVAAGASRFNGNILIGQATNLLTVGSTIPGVQIAATGTNNGAHLHVSRFLNDTSASLFSFGKSRNGTAGTLGGIVANNDDLGNIEFYGDDGTAFVRAAIIRAQVDGTPGTNDMPGRLVFSTTAGGASSPTERLRIDSTGFVSLGGDTNTGFSNPSADNLAITTGGSERARIDSSGRLLMGTSAAYVAGGNVTSRLQLHGADASNSSWQTTRWSANNGASLNSMQKSRGASVGTREIVIANDDLGIISFSGDDGTDFMQAANIKTAVDGTPSTADMPGRLVFSTTADGASGPGEALRITNDNVVAYNQAAPAAVNTTATITAANLKTGIITSSTAAAVTMTLPTGTDIEAGFSGIYTGMTFEFSVINTGPDTLTVGANGNTTVGSLTVATGTSARYALRRTGGNAFTLYRLS